MTQNKINYSFINIVVKSENVFLHSRSFPAPYLSHLPPPSFKKGREEYVTCSDSIHLTNIYITLQRIPVPLWEGKPPKILDLQ